MLQRTEQWIADRLGKATASRIADATARTKTGWGASRANYMAELIAERLTGVPQDSYVNAAMQHGIDTEAEARAAYSFYSDSEVIEVGFIAHPSIAMAGASPDGLVGEHGLVELKAPNTATHIETLLGAAIDGKYIRQVQFQMACTGRKWVDWCSYDPRLPEEMRLFIKRVPRDDAMIATLEKEITEFLTEVEAKTRALSDRFLRKAAA